MVQRWGRERVAKVRKKKKVENELPNPSKKAEIHLICFIFPPNNILPYYKNPAFHSITPSPPLPFIHIHENKQLSKSTLLSPSFHPIFDAKRKEGTRIKKTGIPCTSLDNLKEDAGKILKFWWDGRTMIKTEFFCCARV